MRLGFSEERVLAVTAHPDDAELLCVGTLARAKSEGAPIGLCVLCLGDKGQPDPPIEDLVRVRREELTAAAHLLGVELFQCGFRDGELFDGTESRRALVQVYREFRPTLVLAHSPDDYHMDHRTTSSLAETVSWLASSSGQKTTPPALPSPPALWWMDTINMSGFEPHFYIDVSDYVGLKRRMLACHESQLQRGEDTAFSPLEQLMLRQSEARGAQSGVAAAEAFRSHTAWRRIRAW